MKSETDLRAAMPEFLLHTSHDLRTALRAIRMHSDLLLKDGQAGITPGLEERLGFIVNGAQKIEHLAEGIASYSIALQIDRNTFQAVPLNAAVRAVLAKLDKEIQANEAVVSHDQLPQVLGDMDRLMEVFQNLIVNALYHRGPAAPRVQISVEQQQGQWRFKVKDNGPGISESYLQTIFEPFVHLQANKHMGPGLGLSICRIIVERHGGRIWAETQAGGGAAFLFVLPAV